MTKSTVEGVFRTEQETQYREPYLGRDELMRRDARCAEKAHEKNEIVFTLRAQDLSSPKVIVEWIKENIETCTVEKLHQALDVAIAMTNHTTRKNAD